MTRFFDGVHAQRRAVALLLGGAILLGVLAARQLPTSILPEVTFPRISILAEAGELPADVVTTSVTRPLEEALRRVPGVLEIRSTTSRGSTEINLDCEWRSDMDLTLQRVQAQIAEARAGLPTGTTLEARLMSPTMFPIVGFSLVSDRSSLAALRDAAVIRLKPELSRLPGVAEVQRTSTGIVVTGIASGIANIRAMEGTTVLATLQVTVKNQLDKSVAFHYVSDSAPPPGGPASG